jgi:hypothetical protein
VPVGMSVAMIVQASRERLWHLGGHPELAFSQARPHLTASGLSGDARTSAVATSTLTSASSRVSVSSNTGALRRILVAGALLGLTDICYAWLLYVVILGRTTYIRVAQSIASGVLGKATYDGGAATAALGLTLHFTIAFIWTVFFYLLLRYWPPTQRMLRAPRGPVYVGLAYGAVIWLVMNLVVIPLSRARGGPLFTWINGLSILVHAALLGLPMVLILSREHDLDARRRSATL